MRPENSAAIFESSDATRKLILLTWMAESVGAAVLLVQRLTGSFRELPPASAVLLFAGVCLAVNLMAVALFGRISRRAHTIGLMAVTSLPPLVIGLSLLSSDAAGARFSLFASVLLSAVVAGLILRSQASLICEAESSVHVPTSEPETHTADVVPVVREEPLPVPIDESETTESDDRQTQWMQRRLSDDGRQEIIEGEISISFAAGQKQAAVHLPFSPPLAGIPQVECEPLDGTDIRWKVTIAQPYGVRIDVHRKTDLGQETTIRLAYFATENVVATKLAG